MPAPAPGYRTLFYLTSAVAAALAAVVFVQGRRFADYRTRAEDLNPFALSVNRARDKNYPFAIDNYGYVYKGATGDLIDDTVLAYGAWEKYMLFFMADYAVAAGVADRGFLDVGANTGQHAMFMARRVKEVHAVEPYPPVLVRLHDHVASNGFKNLFVHEVGFGDADAVVPFHAPPDGNHGSGSFQRPAGGGATASSFRVVRGDDYLKGVPAVPFGVVVVDVEGYEEPALKGLRQTLDRDRPLVIVEVLTPAGGGTIASVEQLQALLPEKYKLFYFADRRRQYVNGGYDIQEFRPAAGQFFASGGLTNVVAVPAEKVGVTPRRNAGD